MKIDYTDDQRELRNELRDYMARLLRDVGPRAQDSGDWYRNVRMRLGTDGWLGIGWPTEYGGQGRSALEQFIFFDEGQRAGVPLPTMALNTVGPTIMRFGSEEQKEEYLPRILSGEIDFSIGYTEPDAGTDLASLTTRAVREDDVYLVNGAKIWTTGGQVSDYIWLAARTDPEAPNHHGISILIVPTTSPGFRVTPIRTFFVERARETTATFYENVRVPVANLVGDENAGWKLITSQLNHERVAMAAYGGATLELYEKVRHWAAEQPTAQADRLIDVPWIQTSLARVHARLEAMKLLNWRMAWAIHTDDVAPASASAAKVYGTEAVIEACRLMLDIVGQAGYLAADSPGAVLAGELERAYRTAVIGTFGGGNNDIQREIIASAGLGMPRAPR